MGMRKRGSVSVREGVCVCEEREESTPSAVRSVFLSPSCSVDYSSHSLLDSSSYYWKLPLNQHRGLMLEY